MAPRTQTGLAVSASGETWTLVNASPDLRTQLLSAKALQPAGAVRSSPIAAVVLTGAEIDQIAGLLDLREGHGFAVYGTPAVLDALDENPVFGGLDRGLVERRPLAVGTDIRASGLRILAFDVPGKPPLYAEDRAARGGLTVGLEISEGSARCLFIPGCARITPELAQRIAGAALLLLDGTTFTDDEMIAAGLSHKTAGRMGHMAMAGPAGTLAALSGLAVKRKLFIHINNSNPALIDGSPERQYIREAGWDLAEDGMEFEL